MWYKGVIITLILILEEVLVIALHVLSNVRVESVTSLLLWLYCGSNLPWYFLHLIPPSPTSTYISTPQPIHSHIPELIVHYDLG